MNIIESKIFRFTFELTTIDKDGQVRTNPFRFDVQSETQEEAKVKLLRDLQQVVEQIAQTLPQQGKVAKKDPEGKG